MKYEVTMTVGAFACEALAGEGEANGYVPLRAVRAIRCYLRDRDAGHPGWPYPEFMRGEGPGEEVELRIALEEGLWKLLEEEAERQGVSTRQMLEHAMLYFAAEVDAGRVTKRILDDLDDFDD